MSNNVLDASLPNRIRKFINNIELRQAQKTKIQNSHKYLRKNYLEKLDYVEKTFLTGSYKKNTLVNHPKNDIDIFVVLKGYEINTITPYTILDKLKKDLKSKYTTTIIKQDKPCVVLEFQHITFELTPVIQIDNSIQSALGFDSTPEFYMPDISTSNEWIRTENPRILEQKLSTANKSLNAKLVPLIKMMKQCKLYNNIETPKSFEMEQLAIDSLYDIAHYRDGIEQLLKIYNWSHKTYSHLDILQMSDRNFAIFCRDDLFGNKFPKIGV